jgi:hypothetical protein
VSPAYSEEDKRGLDKSSPLMSFTRSEVPGLALYFAIAVAAIDRLAIARFEGNLGGFTAV